MNRRSLLRAAGAAAALIPLAPVAALLVPPSQVLPSTALFGELHYATAWLPFRDEALADNAAIDAYVRARFAAAWDAVNEDWLMNGDGSALVPLGRL